MKTVLRLLSGILCAAALPGCSVPQFDPAKPALPATTEQLMDAGHYRRALALVARDPAPADAAAKSPTPQELARHLNLLSRVQSGLGQWDAAMELVERALTFDAMVADFHVQAANVAGREAEHAGLFKQLALAKRVKKELDDALTLDPKNADAIFGLALFEQLAPSFLGGDKEKAQALAAQLTEMDPPRGYLTQARLAHERKNPAQEEVFLKKALDAGPDSYEAQIAFATFAYQSDPVRVDEADEHACLALELDPGRAGAWQILAELAATAGCWREVDGLVNTAAQFIPDDLSPAYFAAEAMVFEDKNPTVAQSLLKRYLSQPQEGGAPSSGRARYQLALISEKQGEREEAVDLLRIALTEDPTLDEAKKALKRLDHGAKTPSPATLEKAK
jgi:tetratricopeptide (TPR) repeat protein